LNGLVSIWRPAAYHGFGRRRRFFEGWYYKSVSADESATLAVIPGISFPDDAAAAHAFVMVAEPGADKPRYFRFPVSAFSASRRRFDVRIGPNRFAGDGLELDLADDRGRIRGRLDFTGVRPWPVRPLSPGAMGWYAFVPTMECYHGVLSFDHDIRGTIEMDGSARDFGGGRGYLEKDWGVSMPASWIWIQTNHFDGERASLFASIARIPWRGRSVTGFLFGFLFRGRVHRLATYTGARITALEVGPGTIRVAVEGRRARLEIEADRSEGVELPAPSFGDMTSKVRETLRSRVRVRWTAGGPGKRDEAAFSGTGRNAGLELVGDIAGLMKGLKRP